MDGSRTINFCAVWPTLEAPTIHDTPHMHMHQYSGDEESDDGGTDRVR